MAAVGLSGAKDSRRPLGLVGGIREVLGFQAHGSALLVYNAFFAGNGAVQEVPCIHLNARLIGINILANILGWGVGVVCTVVGIVWSLIVIALAWLFYRPVLGIALLAVAGFLIWFFAFKGKDKIIKKAEA